MNYEPVTKALAEGAEPSLLCTTCPWDRNCVTPPSMTRAEIDAKIDEAQRKDDQRDPEKKKMPVGALVTALTLGGRDMSATICPVLALRLRSSDGRAIAEAVKAQMQNWDDS